MKVLIIEIVRSSIPLLFSSNSGPAHLLNPNDYLLGGNKK